MSKTPEFDSNGKAIVQTVPDNLLTAGSILMVYKTVMLHGVVDRSYFGVVVKVESIDFPYLIARVVGGVEHYFGKVGDLITFRTDETSFIRPHQGILRDLGVQ